MDDLSAQIGDLLGQPAFYWGVAAVLLALILLWFGGVVVAQWNKILQFFAPAKPPSPAPARTPWQRFLSCLGALLFFLVLLVVLGAALYWFMGGG
jgi:hypothetical protein